MEKMNQKTALQNLSAYRNHPVYRIQRELNRVKLLLGSVLLAALLFGASGCSKAYLDVQPNNIITTENFYRTQEDAIAAVTSAYTPIQGMYNGSAWHIGDIMSDDTDLGGGGGGDGIETAELDNFTLTPFNPIVNIIWSQAYQGIFRSNIVLEKVPAIAGMSESVRTRVLGEAHFLRAFYYFQLVRLFGDVPLYTNIISVDQARTIARSPRQEVYALIVSDLREAETKLPASYTGADVGRATSGAAKGLLANVYLTLQDKPNAAAKALEVIQSNRYRLWDDYADNFKLENENGRESIFEVQYRNGGQQWSDYGQGQKLNCFFAPRLQGIVQSDGYGWNIPTANFVAQYERDPNNSAVIRDRRRPGSMWIPGDQFGSYTQPNALVGSPNGFNVRKYFIPASNTEADAGGWSCALNVPVMRYSEILLIYAEAAGPALGKQYIDQVRARAGLDPLPNNLSDAAYLEAVYKERRIEFAFEMHRWHDLLRHPDPNYFITVMRAHGKSNVQAKHRFLPIPQSERDINPNLSQNPEY